MWWGPIRGVGQAQAIAARVWLKRVTQPCLRVRVQCPPKARPWGTFGMSASGAQQTGHLPSAQ